MIYTISTAGHIDHGKSTLVKALTGINPDRLPEELEREMTIDLGFAWFALDENSDVGIVDVPGHERFIRNMISGVGGIDYVLFVVAADDGWMPQSQEHLEILDLLGHKHGALILTKIDLVKEDWIKLVIDDLKNKVRGTFLENAPMFKFSAPENIGLDAIKAHLKEVLPRLPARYNPQKPRLYIDRVFSLTGIGTVVTGTMRDGSFKSGDELYVVPSGKHVRIKSIQTFKQQRDQSSQGARTALSLTGVSKDEISRGDCLIEPDEWRGTRDLGLRVRFSDLNHIPLTHNRSVTILIGTTEISATARLFREDDFRKKNEGICLLDVEQEILARIGDRVILRYPTPDVLVGGGEVVDVELTRFIRRDKDLRKFYLERRLDRVDELILSELRKYKVRESNKILEASNFSKVDIEGGIDRMLKSGVIAREGSLIITSEYRESLFEKVLNFVEAFHGNNPSRKGVSKSEIVSKLGLDQSIIDFALKHLSDEKKLSISDSLVFLLGHKTSLKPEQEKIRRDILERLSVPDLMTPTRREIEGKTHQIRDVLNYLVQNGEVVELGDGILFTAADFQRIKNLVVSHIKKYGSIEVKDIKNALGLTRKYTIPIFEYLDEKGVTRREGDKRILNV